MAANLIPDRTGRIRQFVAVAAVELLVTPIASAGLTYDTNIRRLGARLRVITIGAIAARFIGVEKVVISLGLPIDNEPSVGMPSF